MEGTACYYMYSFLMLSCVVLMPLLCYGQVYNGGYIQQRKIYIHCGVPAAIGLLFSWLNILFFPTGLDVPNCDSH